MALLLLRSARAGVGLGTSLRLTAVSGAQPGAAAGARCFAAQADAAAAKVWGLMQEFREVDMRMRVEMHVSQSRGSGVSGPGAV